MLRLLLSVLMLVTLSEAQQKKVITRIITDEGDKTEASVKVEVEDNLLKFRIEKDGDIQEFEVDCTDKEALAEMEKTLAELGASVHIKGIHDDKHMAFRDKRGFLGVQIQDLGEQLREYFKVKGDAGVLVSEVEEDSPADKSGLKAGDVILKVNDEDVADTGDLTHVIRNYDPGTEVTLSILRNGRKKSIKSVLGETEDRFLAWNHPDQFRGPRAKMFKYGVPFKHFDKDFDIDIDVDDLGERNMEHYMFLKDSELKEELEDLKDELREMKKELKELRHSK
ncbi:MAG: PDZ domain-containing protein [Candidatus Neomarinimicrobiota bacterium]